MTDEPRKQVNGFTGKEEDAAPQSFAPSPADQRKIAGFGSVPRVVIPQHDTPELNKVTPIPTQGVDAPFPNDEFVDKDKYDNAHSLAEFDDRPDDEKPAPPDDEPDKDVPDKPEDDDDEVPVSTSGDSRTTSHTGSSFPR